MYAFHGRNVATEGERGSFTIHFDDMAVRMKCTGIGYGHVLAPVWALFLLMIPFCSMNKRCRTTSRRKVKNNFTIFQTLLIL